jgi:formate hydrogenlyase subunit 3/multisubunit Na+/H+ antiporter MnhD subunit
MEWGLLDLLWSVAALTVLGAFGVRGGSGSWLQPLLYLLQLLLIAGMMMTLEQQGGFPSALHLSLLGYEVGWLLDGLGLYFALITVGAALFVSLYMAGAWGQNYQQQGGSLHLLHFVLALNVLTMLLLLASDDLLSLFIGWELASWSAFVLMALAGGSGWRAASRYLIYAMGGAMLIFAALAMVAAELGTLQLDAVSDSIGRFSAAEAGLLLALTMVGFGIKMGVVPFHLWQAPAYAGAPGPAAAFLGAISSRLGLYAMVVVLFKLAEGRWFSLALGGISAQTLLAWIAAATILFPTFTAMRQNDARELLAWHGIGQGGYMLLGVVMMDSLGVAGGMLHIFNHATYQAALFLAVTAVIYRTGSSDLNRLGGLVVRMPLTFVTMLVGIIGLAGLPPMNGFVSKWLVYRSLLDQGEVLLFVAAVAGTLGTILSVYKLLHNTFLGSLRLEHQQLREVEWSMLLPMLLLSVLILLTGIFPGIVLLWVEDAVGPMGLLMPLYTLGGVVDDGGSLDMRIVTAVLLAGMAIAALLFYRGGGPSRRVHPLDNYAGGHFLHTTNHYHYSNNFYAGLMHLIKPWYRALFQRAEDGVVRTLRLLAEMVGNLSHPIHSGRLALLLLVVLLWWGGAQ